MSSSTPGASKGLREEGTTTAEMGWGTHEKQLPPLAFEHAEGPKNQICLARMGMNTWVRSWVPNYSIRGMVVRHGEAFTLSDKLTVWEDDKAIYRPTVHYAYCPCNCAVMSLHELRGYGYKLQPNLRIMTDEIIGGEDIFGALIMGHPYKAWWTGSILGIEESRRLVRHQNSTTMQVAISVVAAVDLDDRESRPRRARARRPAARLHPRHRQSVPRRNALDPRRLDAAARHGELFRRLQPPRPRLGRSRGSSRTFSWRRNR